MCICLTCVCIVLMQDHMTIHVTAHHMISLAYIPCPGGLYTAAWPMAVRTDCSARPMRSFPPSDLHEYMYMHVRWHVHHTTIMWLFMQCGHTRTWVCPFPFPRPLSLELEICVLITWLHCSSYATVHVQYVAKAIRRSEIKSYLMRYRASECLQATNSPLMISTFFAMD